MQKNDRNLESLFFAQEREPLVLGLDDLGQARQRGPEQGEGVIVGKDSPTLIGLPVEHQEEKKPPLGIGQHLIRHPASDTQRDVLGIGHAVELLVGDLHEPTHPTPGECNWNTPAQEGPIDTEGLGTGVDLGRPGDDPLSPRKLSLDAAQVTQGRKPCEPGFLGSFPENGLLRRFTCLDRPRRDLRASVGMFEQQQLALSLPLARDERRDFR
jgi:hypothetical protein